MDAAPGTGFQRQKGFDMLVLGGGIAGLAAACSGARLGISVALVEQGPGFGGQVATLGTIDDYPAVASQSGAELAAQLASSAVQSGAAISEDTVLGMRRTELQFAVETRQRTLHARSVVIATGARRRSLELPGIDRLEGRGISHCASCDGALFRDRAVAVIGGGDSALQAALQLSMYCSSVSVVVRGRLRARQAYVDAAARRPNLQFVWDSNLEAVLGEDGVTAIRIRNHQTGATAELPCYGMFPLIGGVPNTEFAASMVELTANGYIHAGSGLETSVPGIYAIGAVRAGFCGALASAAGEGVAVATELARRHRK